MSLGNVSDGYIFRQSIFISLNVRNALISRQCDQIGRFIGL